MNLRKIVEELTDKQYKVAQKARQVDSMWTVIDDPDNLPRENGVYDKEKNG